MTNIALSKLPIGSIITIDGDLYCICYGINGTHLKCCANDGWLYWDEIESKNVVKLIFRLVLVITMIMAWKTHCPILS